LTAAFASPQVLLQPSKQHNPKLGQSPSGCPGDQQVDTEPAQEEDGRGERAGQESPPPDTPPGSANNPSFFMYREVEMLQSTLNHHSQVKYS